MKKLSKKEDHFIKIIFQQSQFIEKNLVNSELQATMQKDIWNDNVPSIQSSNGKTSLKIKNCTSNKSRQNTFQYFDGSYILAPISPLQKVSKNDKKEEVSEFQEISDIHNKTITPRKRLKCQNFKNDKRKTLQKYHKQINFQNKRGQFEIIQNLKDFERIQKNAVKYQIIEQLMSIKSLKDIQEIDQSHLAIRTQVFNSFIASFNDIRSFEKNRPKKYSLEVQKRLLQNNSLLNKRSDYQQDNTFKKPSKSPNSFLK